MFRIWRSGAAKREQKIFYGWWIVAAAAVSQAYTSGAFWQGFGAFFDPIVKEFRWSHATTSAAVSLQRTETGVISPFVGLFIEKYGPQKVMLSGVLATGTGLILLSRIQSLWQFYAAFALITLGMSFGSFIVVTTTVANWFVKKRVKAMAIYSTGTGLGGMFLPLIVLLISATDWRTGLVVIGVGFWAVGIPVALVLRSRPEDYGYLPDGDPPERAGPAALEEQSQSPTAARRPAAVTREAATSEAQFTIRQALRTRSFWQMAIAMGVGQLIMSASVHHIPAMSSFGFSRQTAGLVIMSLSLMSIVGRLSSGALGDRIDKRRLVALSIGLQSLGTFVFAFTSTFWHLIGFILFWGMGWGMSVPIRFALLADYFGRRHFGSIMGMTGTVSAVFGIAGPVFVGWMFDLQGNYKDPFIVLSVTALLSVPLILTLSVPRQPRDGS